MIQSGRHNHFRWTQVHIIFILKCWTWTKSYSAASSKIYDQAYLSYLEGAVQYNMFNFLENDKKQVKRKKKIFIISHVSEAAVLRLCFMQYT